MAAGGVYCSPLPVNSITDASGKAVAIAPNCKQVLVPELNMGQLLWLLRAKFLVDAIGLNKIQGRPFKQVEVEQKIEELLGVD